jgi:hypothetical protein
MDDSRSRRPQFEDPRGLKTLLRSRAVRAGIIAGVLYGVMARAATAANIFAGAEHSSRSPGTC